MRHDENLVTSFVQFYSMSSPPQSRRNFIQLSNQRKPLPIVLSEPKNSKFEKIEIANLPQFAISGCGVSGKSSASHVFLVAGAKDNNVIVGHYHSQC